MPSDKATRVGVIPELAGSVTLCPGGVLTTLVLTCVGVSPATATSGKGIETSGSTRGGSGIGVGSCSCLISSRMGSPIFTTSVGGEGGRGGGSGGSSGGNSGGITLGVGVGVSVGVVVGAGAADGKKGFIPGFLKIEPALFGSGMDLGVLPGNLVGRDGQARCFTQIPENV